MCNDKVLVEHQGGSNQQNMGMQVVVYNGNSSFDSPCIITHGWIKQADEIERNSSKKSITFKNDCPSFEARLNECADEMNNSKGNEGKDDEVVDQECPKRTKRNVEAVVGINMREKREMKHGPSLKSHFVQRVVDLKDAVEQKEILVAQAIIGLGMDKRELVWELKEGFGMHIEYARAIAGKVNIHSNVIDCLSVLLNKLEESKSESSYSRLYFTTGTLRESMYDESVNEDIRYKELEIMVSSSIEDLTTDSELKNVDLCQAYNRSDDGGIYLMRHMESFMGNQTSKWDCGLAVDLKIQDMYLQKLRYKYLVRLLLSDHNILKCEFEKEYAKFVKMDKATRKKIVQGNLKVVFDEAIG
ncbi:unnamed protein product [Lactuca virosa]|uniref:Uncharacterized protein n=1 Tax=Lactuca virosa TaxID=75947 RepID=A0AAU9P4Y8_9ASTR|nr:unnamed protein product [Lactuca virosa]